MRTVSAIQTPRGIDSSRKSSIPRQPKSEPQHRDELVIVFRSLLIHLGLAVVARRLHLVRHGISRGAEAR